MIDKDGKLVWDNDVFPTQEFPTLIETYEHEPESVPNAFSKPPNALEEISIAADLVKHKYPRIYERIEATWGSIELDTYFDRLIIDDRGNRNGFPKEILNALLVLAKANRKELPINKNNEKNTWALFNYK